jgi:Big-like domain-containing protein
LTASIVTSSSSNLTPGGTVTFFDGNTQIGQSAVSNEQALASVNSLAVRQHSVCAAYSGDINFAVSNSTASAATVTDLTIAATPSALTITRGQSGTFQIAVTPTTGGFPSAVAFAISGLPAGATAAFSPTSVTPGNSAAATTLTISQTKGAAVHSWFEISGVGIFALLLLFAGLRHTRKAGRVLIRRLVAARLLFAGMAWLTSCGSSTHTIQTATRNYSLTITASSGTLAHTTIATLHVQ